MQNVALTWQQAGVLSAALYAGSFAASRTGSPRLRRSWPLLREAATIGALYSLWQFVGQLSLVGTHGAYERGRSLVRIEKELWLPREATVQSWILPHPLIAQLCNLYYASLHFAALFVLLLWLFVRHRDQYAKARSSIIVLTASCLAVQLVPVAPPRLIPQAGVVDIAQRYGQSVYISGGAGVDQLSAMPSVHVGWALLIAMVVIRAGTGPWRWLVVGYPVLTTFVVLATGNHFWLDGILAAVLLALGEVVLAVGRRLRTSRRTTRSADSVSVYSSV
jgi:prepilin signal peptidase PulO-like enzyme (type II secretory pathway)